MGHTPPLFNQSHSKNKYNLFIINKLLHLLEYTMY